MRCLVDVVLRTRLDANMVPIKQELLATREDVFSDTNDGRLPNTSVSAHCKRAPSYTNSLSILQFTVLRTHASPVIFSTPLEPISQR
jgi:hypothetical protein